jgi:hypothetical protein
MRTDITYITYVATYEILLHSMMHPMIKSHVFPSEYYTYDPFLNLFASN